MVRASRPAIGAPAGTPDPNAPPTPIDARHMGWHRLPQLGRLVVAFPPDLFTYKVTFSTAGTYKYQCLIHPDMAGTIKVGS